MALKLFSKFLAVGILNTIVGISLMYSLYYLGFSYWWATFLGNGVGACVSFGLNRSFTFNSEASVRKTILPFFLVIGVCYVLAYSISIGVLKQILSIVPLIPLNHVEDFAILVGAGIYTVLNFIGQRQFVFMR
ncbi:GtrA family protein [Radiobacillus deserti]|uniref:GtrA family protein n=1 Tax=Radiobacillus deserti TaxID=2594883 RepID=A0A516KCE4_9BACI|nr:GtrA family protein [Radiobacillus deserti]QDP39083.1 GtrA family protein [Radiobacillus deserti]